MTAGDATTLRQVSLAANLGIDATVLLATDDVATRLVYDRVVEGALKIAIATEDVRSNNQAVDIIDQLGLALKKA